MMHPKPTPKKKESKKEYKDVRRDYLSEHQKCEVCLTSEATSVHHAAGRLNDLLTDTTYFFAVCEECHAYIHAHPNESYERGWMVHRTPW